MKRSSASEVLDIIEDWIYLSDEKKIEDIDEELKIQIMEFVHKNITTESYPQAECLNCMIDATKKIN